MAIEAAVTSLSLRHGRSVRRAPFVQSWSGRGLFGEFRFHALAEATTPDNDDLCRWALETVHKHLSRPASSLTTGLTRAMQACHRELLQANAEQKSQGRVGLGITCLALQRSDLYLVNNGPGLMYLMKEGGIRRLGPRHGAVQIIGLYEGEIRPYLQHIPIQRGDRLLVSFSTLLRLVTPEGIETILASTPEESIRKLMMVAREEPSFSAFLFHRD
ncbi:MAG: hypothetical protein HYU29_03335 [Chloroflexi bacterium]|nr:hypothetical protein [Chloroflexota bacterium]